MATRKRRSKGQQTPKSAGAKRQVKRAAGLETKLTHGDGATSAGCKLHKLTKKQNTIVTNTSNVKKKLKKNTPARQTKSKSKTASTTSGAPDAYEFDETDDFISGRSSLPTSFSPYGTQKISRNAPFTKTVPKKKGKTTNQQKGKKAKRDNLSKSVTKKLRVSRKVKEDEKKTSTPLLVESANSASKAAQKVSPGKLRRSPRVILPKLELDFSVTPILPVFTPVSPKRVKGDHDASYVAASKSQVTPFLPADQSDRQKTRRQAVLTRHSQSSFSLALHDSASVSQPKGTLAVSTVTEKKDSKRKRSKSNSTRSVETDGNAPAKRQKADHPKTKQDPQSSKQQRQASKKLSKRPKQPKKSSQKEAYSKQTPVPHSRDSLGKKSSKQRNPVTSTQVSHQGAELTGLWEQGKEKMCCVVTPYLHDSGISMGNNTSTSRMTDSSMPSLPGFMEEEPLQCELQDFSSSPLSQLKTAHSFEPVSTVNKSSSVAYKPRKTKRERGSYFTSKLDAWANSVNQDMQDVESFELVVE